MTIIHGECVSVMRTLPDNSVDAIVTDPPYELGFMGKSWDSTGIAFNVEVWAECLRVLKPGGHLLAFSGSRTYHRMAVAIEDAGFEIRDQIMWIYGSGFPKSMNVAASIEAKLTTGSANKTAFKNLQGEQIERGNWGIAKQQQNHGQRETNYDETAGEKRLGKLEPTTAEAKQWQGWGTALKPAHEPIVVARKPLIGTVAANVLTYGTGGLNIDGARVGSEVLPEQKAGQAQIGTFERDNMVTPERIGRWPANVIHDGSDEVVELFPTTAPSNLRPPTGKPHLGRETSVAQAGGTVYDVTERGHIDKGGSAARFFYCAKASKRDRNDGLEGFEIKEVRGGGGRVSEGYDESTQHLKEAARKYGAVKTAKANTHPTVKPTDLMRYLCRLVTPPNGVVLDPFMGSGSTGKAAVLEKFRFIGIEMNEDYVEIAKARIAFAENESADYLL